MFIIQWLRVRCPSLAPALITCDRVMVGRLCADPVRYLTRAEVRNYPFDMPKVFISYRRKDNQYAANLIYDRLIERFSKESVYFDIDAMPAGVDFRRHIQQAVSECDVLLAVIGDHWQELDERGEPRLNNPADYVRIEIAAALARDIPVVPVLVGSAQVPRESELPVELADLAYRNAREVRAGSSMTGDLHRLISGIEQALGSVASKPSPPPPETSGRVRASGTDRDEVAPKQSIEVPKWASSADEDQYGRWAAFELGGQQHRMRWIEPGEFLMGSPEDEPGRLDSEAQHRVSLTAGFWLGEMAVSQSLWKQVTGENPGYFSGENLPVESVSHNDIQQLFLTALNRQIPLLEACLPTEAQWEYACRAGTQTPFSFGDVLSAELANFDGTESYNNQPAGVYRKSTAPVDEFQPNPWGLYQMHGNVWEWCADGQRRYMADEKVVDPIGPDGGERVLRGGAWNASLGRYLRSAGRYANSPDRRTRDIGFRLAQVPE